MLSVTKLEPDATCLICERLLRVAPLSGIEDGGRRVLPIRNCPYCGPVDFEVMQLCREAVIGSRTN